MGASAADADEKSMDQIYEADFYSGAMASRQTETWGTGVKPSLTAAFTAVRPPPRGKP